MSEPAARRVSPPDPRGEFPLDPTTYFFHLFAVVSRHREARIDAMLQPLGLNLSRHRALSVIGRLQSCTMSELAEFTAVDRTTMTRIVDQLVEAGLVERRTPPEDRRQVLLNLTSAGLDTANKSLEAIRLLGHELMEGLADDTRREGARTLVAILGNMLDDPALVDRLRLTEATGSPRQGAQKNR